LSSLFATYSLATSIGPVTGTGIINSEFSFATPAAKFVINSLDSLSTFSASVSSVCPAPFSGACPA
jgi:hypothetical protein